MKKTSSLHSRDFKSKVEYAVIEQPNNIENRSEANIDDGEYIRSHWQKNIIKHQPPIIRTMEDLKLLNKGKNP
ncbi:hypothetical protein [Prevotella intermedia]|jgi:hypothetical protein|uniref:hypothetical protein n=1 Tax=Prevotella intermedia TaxID=28131 RepID=UPI0005EB3910|nr:hypothetical protein [Prevotella intermedia]